MDVDFGDRDCPSTPLDNLLNLIYLATEAPSDSFEFIGTIQMNLSAYLSLCLSGFVQCILCLWTAAQGRVGDIIDELFDISSEYLGFISSNIAKVCHRHQPY